MRRILKPGGIFFFNPYGNRHTWPFPDQMPPATKWDEQSVHRLLPDVKWDVLEILHATGLLDPKPDAPVEHTLRVLAASVDACRSDQRVRADSNVHGSGRSTLSTTKYSLTVPMNLRRPKCWMWPGVLPRSFR